MFVMSLICTTDTLVHNPSVLEDQGKLLVAKHQHLLDIGAVATKGTGKKTERAKFDDVRPTGSSNGGRLS